MFGFSVKLKDSHLFKGDPRQTLLCQHTWFWFFKSDVYYRRINSHWHSFPDAVSCSDTLDAKLDALENTTAWVSDHKEMVAALKNPDLAALADTNL